jgi:hypothetical protein
MSCLSIWIEKGWVRCVGGIWEESYWREGKLLSNDESDTPYYGCLLPQESASVSPSKHDTLPTFWARHGYKTGIQLVLNENSTFTFTFHSALQLQHVQHQAPKSISSLLLLHLLALLFTCEQNGVSAWVRSTYVLIPLNSASDRPLTGLLQGVIGGLRPCRIVTTIEFCICKPIVNQIGHLLSVYCH